MCDASWMRLLARTGLGYALALAYPRRSRWVAVLVVLSAAGLELGQLLSPGRHPRLQDAEAKALGGVLGVVMAAIPWWLASRTSREEAHTRVRQARLRSTP